MKDRPQPLKREVVDGKVTIEGENYPLRQGLIRDFRILAGDLRLLQGLLPSGRLRLSDQPNGPMANSRTERRPPSESDFRSEAFEAELYCSRPLWGKNVMSPVGAPTTLRMARFGREETVRLPLSRAGNRSPPRSRMGGAAESGRCSGAT